MSLGPFDLTGGPFLSLYATLFAAVLVAGFVIPRRLRPDGRRHRVTDVDQLAYLAGGGARFGDAVVARLLVGRALVMVGRNRFSVAAGATGDTPAERSVLALQAPIRWREIQLALKAYAGPLEERLIALGLFVRDGELAALRFRATLPYALLVGFGAIKLIIGDARGRPTAYLTAFLALTVLGAAVRWFTIDRRTRAGVEAVEQARERSQRLRKAPTSPEIGMAVALFGTIVLAGSGWEVFHRLRSAGGDGGTSSDGGSDGGSSDGGGGCGGGCGGCGG
jgi:uncharacterized protein (TIGR04222 family)